MSETRSLHRKLAQVMYEAERIPKNGHAPKEMGGYPFVQVGDAADFIRKALAEQVVTMMPTKVTHLGLNDRTTRSGGTMTTLDIIVEWTLTDGETGETFTIESFGAGADGGDKYSGKAMTNAMKYAFLAGFLLSTGEDVELGGLEAGPAADDKRLVNAAPPEPDVETEELTGDAKREGMVRLGDGASNKLEARQGPDGYVIGFRLETSKGAIPQVIVSGPAGDALMMATSGNPGAMRDTRATVAGRLFNVKRPGRRSYFRLKVTAWEWGDYKYPADEDTGPEPPADMKLAFEGTK